MKQGVFMRAMASDADEATIDIIGVIGWEANYEKLREMLRSIPEAVKRVVFDIYSPGGDVWEGNGIVQEIGELGKRAETVARVQVAASMATLIAVACQKRSIAANGRFLIHNAWSAVMGDAKEMERMAKTLRDCEQEAAAFYAQQTGGNAAAMLALMAEERWMMPEETKEWGFVQEISDPFKGEEYEAVKQEIVAAGRWPTALADFANEPAKEVDDGSATADGTGSDAATEPPPPEPAPDAEKTEQQIRAELEIEYSEKLAAAEEEVARLQGEMAEQVKLARQHQADKDRAIAQAKADKESAAKTIEDLQAALGKANDRAAKLLHGSITFEPTSYDTWEEVITACGNDYVAAAKLDPDQTLRKAYRAKMAHNQKRG